MARVADVDSVAKARSDVVIGVGDNRKADQHVQEGERIRYLDAAGAKQDAIISARLSVSCMDGVHLRCTDTRLDQRSPR